VLANGDVNDASDPRVAHALWWLHQRPCERAADGVAALRELCGQCGGDGPDICIRGEIRGTVSSSLIVLGDTPAAGRYLHAQGPPDRTPYEDYSPLLRQLAR
jgi:hypothetical protein